MSLHKGLEHQAVLLTFIIIITFITFIMRRASIRTQYNDAVIAMQQLTAPFNDSSPLVSFFICLH